MIPSSAGESQPSPAASPRSLSQLAASAFVIVLLIIHAGLFLIGVAGMWEWLSDSVPWTPFSNSLFPRSILLLEWLSLIGAGALFVVGYARGWRRLPVVMLVVYTALSAQCAVHTFGFLQHDARFTEMAIEYAEYAVILLFLYRSEHLRRRSARRNPDASAPLTV
jgi:cation transport ATPase